MSGMIGTLEEFSNELTGKRIALDEAIKNLKDLLKQKKKEREEIEQISKMIEGIKTSWQDVRPGKYGPSFYILSESEDRAVPEGCISEDQVCDTKEEWEEYRKNSKKRWESPQYEMVPFDMPIVSLEEAKKEECPHCSTEQLLIEEVCQTRDSPLGDTWMNRKWVLCLECKTAEIIDTNSWSN